MSTQQISPMTTIGKIHAHVTLDPTTGTAVALADEEQLARHLETDGRREWMKPALDRELLPHNVHVQSMRVERTQSLEILLLLGAVVAGIRSYNELFATVETAVQNTRRIIERIVDLWLAARQRSNVMALVETSWEPESELLVAAGAAEVEAQRAAAKGEAAKRGSEGTAASARVDENALREAVRRAASERGGIPRSAWQIALLGLGALSYIVVLVVAAAVVLRLVD